jgi:hypothetical protein
MEGGPSWETGLRDGVDECRRLTPQQDSKEGQRDNCAEEKHAQGTCCAITVFVPVRLELVQCCRCVQQQQQKCYGSHTASQHTHMIPWRVDYYKVIPLAAAIPSLSALGRSPEG